MPCKTATWTTMSTLPKLFLNQKKKKAWWVTHVQTHEAQIRIKIPNIVAQFTEKQQLQYQNPMVKIGGKTQLDADLLLTQKTFQKWFCIWMTFCSWEYKWDPMEKNRDLLSWDPSQ